MFEDPQKSKVFLEQSGLCLLLMIVQELLGLPYKTKVEC